MDALISTANIGCVCAWDDGLGFGEWPANGDRHSCEEACVRAFERGTVACNWEVHIWTRHFCIHANKVWKIPYLRTSTRIIWSHEGMAPTSVALIVSPLASLMVNQNAALADGRTYVQRWVLGFPDHLGAAPVVCWPSLTRCKAWISYSLPSGKEPSLHLLTCHYVHSPHLTIKTCGVWNYYINTL